MSRTEPTKRSRNPSFKRLFPRNDTYPIARAKSLQSTIHASSAESPLTSLIKDLRRHEWQVLSLSSTLEKERVDHKKHFDDLKAAHAKDIAIVNENHARQLMEINMRHKEDITRVKMWCEVNQPRPNELARILERQRRSALQAELRLMKEEAESRDLWNETRVQKLNRESDEVENRLAKLQRQWDDIVAWFSG
ncbi:unnamed protein product [Alternaria alternata]|uniref:Uncharacterized protein n=1 Tax=Alternaria tenuissima TaxID=119927 RepID=A0A4Q4MWP4_9PLEO|nr:hypothetical protein AA0114_g39 [Alternaria tenuissima]RYN75856.1 hypothetical protein AA0120_g11773 [Alternaria tenuissima]